MGVAASLGKTVIFESAGTATRLGMVLQKNWESSQCALALGRRKYRESETANPLNLNELAVRFSIFSQSGRLDLNQRPPAPEAGALPG